MTDYKPNMAVCNFCEKEYDQTFVHTCAGNQIYPAKKRGNMVPEVHGPNMAEIGHMILEDAAKFPTALNGQVGGDHYRKLPIQPVEYIIANKMGFLPGNIVKYATRYKEKGGAEDIRKIKQCCDFILEFEYKEKA